ncbi:MAG TPA: hypothetical protein VN645_05420 [Steroidobacteraceae bacterium]|nr:hypothetical protein [Steroidobacteraceae bacterium]
MNRLHTRGRALVALGAAALISACSGGGSVNLGSGQAADPGSQDFPIAYVKRTIPMMNGQLAQDDVRAVRNTLPDADLYFRDRASPSSVERNVTDRVTGSKPYDIKDVDVSPDGKKIVFAMRGPLKTNQKEKEAPSWEIWEYDIPSDNLRRVIQSDTISAEGQDIGPQYLPDGRILFTSTRQRQSQAILRDEGKPGFEAQTDDRSESAFVLHVMKADGTSINQISFNQSHDLSPSVMADGRVLFSRWDGATGRGFNLYSANPDGTHLQLLYGARSHMTGTPDANGPSEIQFTRPREMQNGRILTLVRPFTDTDLGGDLVMIDANMYVENTQPLAAFAGATGPAQSRATPNEVTTVPGPSPGGRFRSGYPLWDGTNRILVSWSQCRLVDTTVTPNVNVPCTPQRLADPNVKTAPPLYSAFIFNPADNTFKPLFEPVEGIMITDLVAAQPRALPAVILDKVPVVDFNPDLQTQGVGILDIRSVYDFDGTTRSTGTGTPSIGTLANPSLRTADQRPARFLRIEKAVSMGDKDLGFPDIDRNVAIGSGVGFMREILGYAPIEPDGSVSVRVPANVAFVISILDKDGRRISTPHRNWLQLRPGETRQCNGCHQPAAGNAQDLSHGRDGTSASAWAGASSARFPGTVAAFSPNTGETMAQTKARTTCVPGQTCSQMLSVNVNYVDDWTDPVVRTPDAAFSSAYNAPAPVGLTTLPPVPATCLTTWNSTCRTTINYVPHIHPLWYVPRITLAADGMTVLSDHTCTACHTPVDPVNNAPRVPAGQLDLSDGDSPQQALHKAAYHELLFASDELELVGGVVVPRVVTTTTIDPVTGLPVTTQTTPQVSPSLAATSARGSRFFSRFAAGGSHAGYLTPAELRLISEWVDIGAQYFNNPFDPAVPLN